MKSEYKCPYTAFKKPCADLNDDCPKWVRILGHNPQSDEPVDKWDCADRWTPLLIIECARETRHAAAAIESFRNEVARAQSVVDQQTPLLSHDLGREPAGDVILSRDEPA